MNFVGETAQADERRDLPAPATSDLTELIDKAPPMHGGEYLQRDVLIALWQATERALEIELSESKLPLQDFMKARNSRWRLLSVSKELLGLGTTLAKARHDRRIALGDYLGRIADCVEKIAEAARKVERPGPLVRRPLTAKRC